MTQLNDISDSRIKPPLKTNSTLAPVDASWIDEDPESYFARPDFQEFQEMAGLDLHDLLSHKISVVEKAQQKIVSQSKIFAEIRNEHSGYSVPFLYYTHDFKFAQDIPHHNVELDKKVLAMSQGDSLRRRHIALSHGILPNVITDLANQSGRPISLKNLGSGVGLDTLHATVQGNGQIDTLLNYDTDADSIDLGQKLKGYLEEANLLKPGIVQYIPKSFTRSFEPADIIVKIGVICGLQDPMAQRMLAADYKMLNEGGKLVISSSNENMRERDPLGSFLIQHIGTREDPKKGWGLNFRTREALLELLKSADFSDVQIYDDANYPGKDDLPDETLYGVEMLPSKALGHEHSGKPLSLPPKEILDQNVAYNWIAVATK